MAIKTDDDFPVEHGRIATIICTSFIEACSNRLRSSARSSSTANLESSVATQSRNVLPVKKLSLLQGTSLSMMMMMMNRRMLLVRNDFVWLVIRAQLYYDMNDDDDVGSVEDPLEGPEV